MHGIRETRLRLYEWLVGGLIVLGSLAVSAHYAYAEEIRILESNAEAFDARLELVARAEREIVIACHDSDAGYVVRHLAAALAARVEQGVRVRLIVDGLLSKRSYDQLYRLTSLAIEVKVFHPTGSRRLSWLNRRLHSKIMVCDDVAMIVGSRNLTDSHFGLSGDSYIDQDFLVEGDLSRCGKKYFDWLWSYEGSIDIDQAIQWQWQRKFTLQKDPPSSRGTWPPPDDRSDDRSDDRTDWPHWLGPCGGPCATDPGYRTIASSRLALVYDRDIAKNNFSFEEQVLKQIELAKCEIVVETPYPAFSTRLKSALIRAARRGVSVTLLTNSMERSDQLTTVAALLNHKRALLRAGVAIREYRGQGLIHAKTLIVDRAVAWVGSYNFDPRGNRLNLELCLQVTDPDLVGTLKDRAWRRSITSARITRVGLGSLSRQIPLKTRLKVRAYQMIMPLIRPSL